MMPDETPMERSTPSTARRTSGEKVIDLFYAALVFGSFLMWVAVILGLCARLFGCVSGIKP
jgi:hypothetical protein